MASGSASPSIARLLTPSSSNAGGGRPFSTTSRATLRRSGGRDRPSFIPPLPPPRGMTHTCLRRGGGGIGWRLTLPALRLGQAAHQLGGELAQALGGLAGGFGPVGARALGQTGCWPQGR